MSDKPRIVAYLKSTCPWSTGVHAVLAKHGLEYEVRDVLRDREQFAEMIRKSGQSLAPCVEVNGHMLADVSGEEVEAWLLAQGLVASQAA
jgi:monothiol glutaredoxin